MRLTLSSLPLFALSSSQAVWNTGDGTRWRENKGITSASVSEGVVNLTTSELGENGEVLGAFQGCDRLESVTLPESLRSIGASAFNACALKHVHVPFNVGEVLAGTFFGCEALETVKMDGGSLMQLSESVFEDCVSLRSVVLPLSLKSIGKDAFRSCSSLSDLNLKDLSGLERIEISAFQACGSLAILDLPESLKRIGEEAFNGCSSIKSVSLPSSVETVGERAFQDCSNLASVDCSNAGSIEQIKEQAFGGCSSLTTFKLPPSLKTIEKNTFMDCGSLSQVELPSSLETIKEFAFSGCSSLRTIKITPTLETIKKYAFKGCSKELTLTHADEAKIREKMLKRLADMTKSGVISKVVNASGVTMDLAKEKKDATASELKKARTELQEKEEEIRSLKNQVNALKAKHEGKRSEARTRSAFVSQGTTQRSSFKFVSLSRMMSRQRRPSGREKPVAANAVSSRKKRKKRHGTT